MLVKWAISRCEKDGLPAYLEGTRNALRFYESHGFRVMGTVAMELEAPDSSGQSFLYEEDCLLFRPGNVTASR
jgi:hypothetical protein